MTVLKFGKYGGEHICDVPAEYLEFLVESASETIATCNAELARRAAAEEASMAMVARILESGFRTLEASLPWVASGG